MFKLIIFFPFLLNALLIDYNICNTKFKNIEILDSKEYISNANISELSDLVYKNHILYALSDKGVLHKFNIDISNNKIKSLKLFSSYKLKDKKGKKLKKKFRDSEGLAWFDGKLLISFEDQNRVMLYDVDAIAIKKIKINKKLRNNNNYKSKNSGLEGVTYSSIYGVVTSPEVPLRHYKKKYHRLYSKNKVWKFLANGDITALEFIDSNKIMVLLRDFDFFTRQRVSTLIELDLSKCKDICPSKLIVKLDSNNGCNLDNFEGLTKIKDNIYLMVSDDNDNFLQKTIFVLFKIKG